jgi:hypothetical protein
MFVSTHFIEGERGVEFYIMLEGIVGERERKKKENN